MEIELPFMGWVAAAVTVGGCLYFWSNRERGWGLPGMAVLGTVFVWYIGDALYNEYELYVNNFGEPLLGRAWFQVVLFQVGFIAFVPMVHGMMNGSIKRRKSMIITLVRKGAIDHPEIQKLIDKTFPALLGLYILLMLFALTRIDWDFEGLFMPWDGVKAYPWARGRVGGGMLDAVFSFAGYLQNFFATAFGLVAAISKNPRTRALAFVGILLSWPYFVFDRTRNTIISTVLPGLLAWIFFRLKGGLVVRAAALVLGLLAFHYWFEFIIEVRSSQNIAVALEQVLSGERERREDVKHEGLNMFEELAWVNYFMEEGTFKPNWGERYIAEAANPIPRAIWPDKPLIGVDYAIARGQGGGGSAEQGGIGASVSTGVIGQGVVNFGPFFGVLAAALIMACYSALLARQDLMGEEVFRLLLYGLGMVLIFNLGRDITLLVLYPFAFGLAGYLAFTKITGIKLRIDDVQNRLGLRRPKPATPEGEADETEAEAADKKPSVPVKRLTRY